jgi:hypothetical protein
MATTNNPGETFTPAERAYIRSELDRYFTTLPTVAEGLMLRTWKTGPHAGQPKLGPAAQSLLDRGFVSLDPHRAHLIASGGLVVGLVLVVATTHPSVPSAWRRTPTEKVLANMHRCTLKRKPTGWQMVPAGGTDRA